MAQYAYAGRRNEFLVPVSREMVEHMAHLTEIAANNLGKYPSNTHMVAYMALRNMNNVITGQDGLVSSVFYGGLYKMLKTLTGSNKIAAGISDNLLSWGYGVGLGFRPGAAIRNILFAPVPVFTMLGGKPLREGISAYMELIKSGAKSPWSKYLDPVNTQFGRSFLDQQVPIYKFMSGGGTPTGPMAKLLRYGLWMQEASERVNRTVSFFAGINAGEDIVKQFAKHGDIHKLLLETPLRMMVEPEQKMLIKALAAGDKETFIKDFALGVVRLTQFAYGPIESFMAANTKVGKLAFFYGTWSSNMLHFIGRALGATVEDGAIRPLSPHAVKFIARWATATGIGYSTLSALGVNPNSTYSLGPQSYTGSPYLQVLLDWIQVARLPGKQSEQAKIQAMRRLQQVFTPFGAAIADGRKAVEDISNDKHWNAVSHIFVGTTPKEESELAKLGIRAHTRGWGM